MPQQEEHQNTKNHLSTQIRLLEEKLKAEPRAVHLYHVLGELHERAGNNDEARKNYLLYLVKSLDFNRESEAIAALEKETEHQPSNKMACLKLGEIYGLLKQFDKSETKIHRGTTWEVSESPHYRYHMVPGSTAHQELEEIKNQWESNYQTVLATLKLPTASKPTGHDHNGPDRHINYYFYESRVHKGVITGDSQLAHYLVAKNEVHLVYSNIRRASGLHEDCHAILHRFYNPVKLLDEGVALFLEVGRNMHDRFREIKGHAYPILQLLDDGFFENSDLFISYPQSGSFVGYLWETYGIDRVKEACQFPNLGQSLHQWKSIFGISLDQLEQQWLQSFDKIH
jgi:tetratricopeptide (TPR) repeat protein